MLDTACHPWWVFDVIGRGRGVPGFGNLAGYFSEEDRAKGRGAAFIVSRLDTGIDWNDLRFLRDNWRGKLVVKGILHARDAMQAASLGADAIVLTNHGGRQLDGTISPMEALEGIRAACPDLDILIDSGFRRGTDIAKALALGANAVMVGRALLYGAAAACRPGIDKAIDILRSELDRTLGQLGVTGISGLERHHLSGDVCACEVSG